MSALLGGEVAREIVAPQRRSTVQTAGGFADAGGEPHELLARGAKVHARHRHRLFQQLRGCGQAGVGVGESLAAVGQLLHQLDHGGQAAGAIAQQTDARAHVGGGRQQQLRAGVQLFRAVAPAFGDRSGLAHQRLRRGGRREGLRCRVADGVQPRRRAVARAAARTAAVRRGARQRTGRQRVVAGIDQPAKDLVDRVDHGLGAQAHRALFGVGHFPAAAQHVHEQLLGLHLALAGELGDGADRAFHHGRHVVAQAARHGLVDPVGLLGQRLGRVQRLGRRIKRGRAPLTAAEHAAIAHFPDLGLGERAVSVEPDGLRGLLRPEARAEQLAAADHVDQGRDGCDPADDGNRSSAAQRGERAGGAAGHCAHTTGHAGADGAGRAKAQRAVADAAEDRAHAAVARSAVGEAVVGASQTCCIGADAGIEARTHASGQRPGELAAVVRAEQVRAHAHGTGRPLREALPDVAAHLQQAEGAVGALGGGREAAVELRAHLHHGPGIHTAATAAARRRTRGHTGHAAPEPASAAATAAGEQPRQPGPEPAATGSIGTAEQLADQPEDRALQQLALQVVQHPLEHALDAIHAVQHRVGDLAGCVPPAARGFLRGALGFARHGLLGFDGVVLLQQLLQLAQPFFHLGLLLGRWRTEFQRRVGQRVVFAQGGVVRLLRAVQARQHVPPARKLLVEVGVALRQVFDRIVCRPQHAREPVPLGQLGQQRLGLCALRGRQCQLAHLVAPHFIGAEGIRLHFFAQAADKLGRLLRCVRGDLAQAADLGARLAGTVRKLASDIRRCTVGDGRRGQFAGGPVDLFVGRAGLGGDALLGRKVVADRVHQTRERVGQGIHLVDRPAENPLAEDLDVARAGGAAQHVRHALGDRIHRKQGCGLDAGPDERSASLEPVPRLEQTVDQSDAEQLDFQKLLFQPRPDLPASKGCTHCAQRGIDQPDGLEGRQHACLLGDAHLPREGRVDDLLLRLCDQLCRVQRCTHQQPRCPDRRVSLAKRQRASKQAADVVGDRGHGRRHAGRTPGGCIRLADVLQDRIPDACPRALDGERHPAELFLHLRRLAFERSDHRGHIDLSVVDQFAQSANGPTSCGDSIGEDLRQSRRAFDDRIELFRTHHPACERLRQLRDRVFLRSGRRAGYREGPVDGFGQPKHPCLLDAVLRGRTGDARIELCRGCHGSAGALGDCVNLALRACVFSSPTRRQLQLGADVGGLVGHAAEQASTLHADEPGDECAEVPLGSAKMLCDRLRASACAFEALCRALAAFLRGVAQARGFLLGLADTRHQPRAVGVNPECYCLLRHAGLPQLRGLRWVFTRTRRGRVGQTRTRC